ncbi:MAG TPA: hypothetical protein VHO03_16750 [Ignavibacteriales bacterium]|nr:hypothetical protein [Ignavibacteriales bacterium]
MTDIMMVLIFILCMYMLAYIANYVSRKIQSTLSMDQDRDSQQGFGEQERTKQSTKFPTNKTE